MSGNKEIASLIDKEITLAATKDFKSLKLWFHVLPFGEITYEGEVFDFSNTMINDLNDRFKKLKGVGWKPVILVAKHAFDNESQTLDSVGFVIDSKVISVKESDDDPDTGLWLKLEIMNEDIARRVESGEIAGISAGIYYANEMEISKTGEKLWGYIIDHVTLTNRPRITWLDKARIQLQEVVNMIGSSGKKDNTEKKQLILVTNDINKRESLELSDSKETKEVVQVTKINKRESLDLSDNPENEGVEMAENVETIELQAENAKLKAREIELAEKLAKFEESEKKLMDEKITERVIALTEKGVVVPGEKDAFTAELLKIEFSNATVILDSLDKTPKMIELTSLEGVENTQDKDNKEFTAAAARVRKNAGIKEAK